MVAGRQRGMGEASASESSVALSAVLGSSSVQEGGQTSTPGRTVTPGLDMTLQPQGDVPVQTPPATSILATSGEQTLTESTTAQVAAVTSPESDPELMSRLLQEAREQMRLQAEQQRFERKHQIAEKTKEVVPAKKEVEMSKKKAKKPSATKKTLTEVERIAELKGLAREAGLMRPPMSTPGITAKELGQAKGRKDLGLPTMVTSPPPLDLGLSPNLGRVSGMLEEVPDDGKLANALEDIPAVDVASDLPARALLVATTSLTSLVGSVSTKSVTSTANEGQPGRRKKQSGVKRAIGLEQSKEGSAGKGATTPQAGEGGKRQKRKELTPPPVTPPVCSPPQGEAEEEEEEEEEVGQEPRVEVDLTSSAAQTVQMLEDLVDPRQIGAFPKAWNSRLNAVAPIISLSRLRKREPPTPHIHVPELLSQERYFTQEYFVPLEDVQENGANARVDRSQMKVLEAKTAERVVRDVFRLKDSGREGAFPDLAPLPKRMKKLVRIVNKHMPTEGWADASRRAELMHLEMELRGALGEAEFLKFCVYVAIVQLTP